MHETWNPFLGNTYHTLDMHIHSNLLRRLNRTFRNQNLKPARKARNFSEMHKIQMTNQKVSGNPKEKKSIFSPISYDGERKQGI